MDRITTDLLDIAYESGGPRGGRPVLLLHGWPDSPRHWRDITPALESAGFRWAAPWLRGFGTTRFINPQTPRDGTGVALAQDAFDFATAIGWDRFSVVGHDWGGRAVYIMSALQPDRLRSGTVMSIGYAPRGQISVPDFDQARRWWYQWFTTVDGGVQAVRDDPVGFARIQWETWGPPGWFKADEFEATAESFRSPDWVDVTLNCYRSRYLPEPLDPRYEGQRKAVGAVERLSTRMLVIHGGLDFCNDPSQSDGQAHLFTGGFRRLVLEGVGHFPAREVPNVVASALISHLQSTL